VVDVLSFSTAVDVVVSRQGFVLPTQCGIAARELAARHHALVAVPRHEQCLSTPYALSPQSLASLPVRSRVILPSPNGAALIANFARDFGGTLLVGCLRNAPAVAAFARERVGDDGALAVIAAGERWPSGDHRPALEDDVGAGAILAELCGSGYSPEADAAARAFIAVRDQIPKLVRECSSGRELIETGYGQDVEYAVAYDVSNSVPAVRSDGFIGAGLESVAHDR